MQRLDIDVHVLGDAHGIGGAVGLGGDFALGLGDHSLAPARVASRDVGSPQVVEDGAADARERERAEREPAVRVPCVDRVQQADAARVDELVELDVASQPSADLVGDVVHEPHVLRDHALAVVLDAVVVAGLQEHRRFEIHGSHRQDSGDSGRPLRPPVASLRAAAGEHAPFRRPAGAGPEPGEFGYLIVIKGITAYVRRRCGELDSTRYPLRGGRFFRPHPENPAGSRECDALVRRPVQLAAEGADADAEEPGGLRAVVVRCRQCGVDEQLLGFGDVQRGQGDRVAGRVPRTIS